MGTHPIFESDFDCLTDRKDLKTFPPWVSISVTTRVTTRRDHTEMLQFLMIFISVSWSRLTDSWPDVLMLNSTRLSCRDFLCLASTVHHFHWLVSSARWVLVAVKVRLLSLLVPLPTISASWKFQNSSFAPSVSLKLPVPASWPLVVKSSLSINWLSKHQREQMEVDESIRAVVAGVDDTFSYRKLCIASLYLSTNSDLGPRVFVATNLDVGDRV